MASIYIHIPFCKQACFYCDFHFSTSWDKKETMLLSIVREMELRKSELQNQTVETIYFGGGTPSILSLKEIDLLLNTIYKNYNVISNPEITLEANPDDLTNDKIKALSSTKINRLSIGIQSFDNSDLKLMNRAHQAKQAFQCLEIAVPLFQSISIDLIYGIPKMDNDRWQKNLEIALSFEIQHLSCYALTVEPKTVLNKLIKIGKILPPKETVAEQHFFILTDLLQKNKFIHYELSNFAKEGFFSKNNSAYWLGKNYLGVGPSAHSYNGQTRSWNVANNSLYIKSLTKNLILKETENLSLTDKYNETIMTGLRTIWGVNLNKVGVNFGQKYLNYALKNSEKFIENKLLIIENEILKTTQKGKFLTDGIASDLFYLD